MNKFIFVCACLASGYAGHLVSRSYFGNPESQFKKGMISVQISQLQLELQQDAMLIGTLDSHKHTLNSEDQKVVVLKRQDLQERMRQTMRKMKQLRKEASILK